MVFAVHYNQGHLYSHIFHKIFKLTLTVVPFSSEVSMLIFQLWLSVMSFALYIQSQVHHDLPQVTYLSTIILSLISIGTGCLLLIFTSIVSLSVCSNVILTASHLQECSIAFFSRFEKRLEIHFLSHTITKSQEEGLFIYEIETLIL
jgi:hypothetical protein